MELLSKIQQQINVPKKHWNSFGNFHYRKTEDIYEAVKTLLGNNSLLVTVQPEIIGQRYYMHAKVDLLDPNGKVLLTTHGYAREPECKPKMDESQTSGSAMTYSIKYALNNMFLFEDSQDPDENNNTKYKGVGSTPPQSPAKNTSPPTPEQVHSEAQDAKEEIGQRFDQTQQPVSRPAPTQNERSILRMLSEYWVTQIKSPNVKLDANLIMDVLWSKLGHYPTLDECPKLKDPDSPFSVPLESITKVV